MTSLAVRPTPDEYDPFYQGYVSRVPGGNVAVILSGSLDDALAVLRDVDEERAGLRYAPGKWSLKEVVGHVVDCERVFTTRAMLFARGDATPLPGIDQDDLIAGANLAGRSLASLLTELEHLRRANVAFFASLDADALARRGTASDSGFTVRALAYVTAGHALHHFDVIRERYLVTDRT